MTSLMKLLGLAAVAGLLLPTTGTALELINGHWVDLSHEYSDEMVTYPRSKPFEHVESRVGMTAGGFFMATYNYSSSEHTGTHLDAPVHFREGGKSIEQLSIEQVVGYAVVIDVKRQVADDMMYLVTVDDILAWEEENGKIPEDAIFIVNTGLANVWPDKIKYYNTDKVGNAGYAEMKNPGIHRDLATFLATERKIKAFGIDAVSFDNHKQPDAKTHRIFFEHDIPGIENMANLDALPATGAYVIGLPMKIKNGSGAPIRIIAYVPDD